MREILFPKKTKWIPLYAYTHNGVDWLLMGRMIIRTGEIQFKQINASPRFKTSYIFKSNGKLFDLTTQFEQLLKQADQ